MRYRIISMVLLGVFVVVVATSAVYQYRAPQRESQRALLAFIKLVRNGQLYDAFRSASGSVQAMTFEDFESAVKERGLTDFRALQFVPVRGRVAGGVKLVGQMEKKDGTKEVLEAVLTRERGLWKLASITDETGGHFFVKRPSPVIETSRPIVPTEEEGKAMALDILRRVNAAVQIGDFTAFFTDISGKWKEKTTKQKLAASFQPLAESGVNLSGILHQPPKLYYPPSADPEGILSIDGEYPSTEGKTPLKFAFRMVWEDNTWRLYSMAINTPE